MGVPAKAAEQEIDLFVQHGVIGDAVHEFRALGRGRQLTEEDQIGDLQKVALGRQVLDRIATMEKDAFLAIDIGDLGRAACGGGEAGIIGKAIGFRIELPNIDHVRADTAFENGKLGAAAVLVRERYHFFILIRH